MKRSFTSVLRASALGVLAIGLAACTTQSGLTYDIHAVQLAGQSAPVYRASCDGLLSSANQCAVAAEEFCQGKGFTPLEYVDRVRSGSPLKDPREITFMCGKPQASAPQSQPQAQPAPQP